jgi:hypothetical protein
MFAFAYVVHLFAYKLSSLSAGRLSFAGIFAGMFQRLFLRHHGPPAKSAYFPLVAEGIEYFL